MLIDNSAKTNWKFIGIVAILAVLVSAGVFVLSTQRNDSPRVAEITRPQVESLTSDMVPLSSLSVGTNRVGNIDIEMLGEFTLIREIAEEDEVVVLDEIDERIIIKQEPIEDEEDESSLVHYLYFGDKKMSGKYSLVGCEFDCLTNYPIEVSALEENGVTYFAFSDVTVGTRSNFTESSAVYRLSISGLEHLADIGGQYGFIIFRVGDISLIFTSSSYVGKDASHSQSMDSIKNAQVKGSLNTTCYEPLGDRNSSLGDDRLFQCDYEPRLFLFEYEEQLHFKIRNVTKDGIEQNSYFQLSENGEFLDVTSNF